MANINTDQSFPSVSLAITDSRGRPAQVDGVPVWASSDETILTVSPSADGMSAVVDTVAASPNPARITVTADADLGAGVVTLTGVSEDVIVSQGPSTLASAMVLNLGAPVNKA